MEDVTSAAVLCLPSGNNREERVASLALLLGFVQRGAATQMEMGSIELTQDIFSCQRFVAFTQLFYRNSLLSRSQVERAFTVSMEI